MHAIALGYEDINDHNKRAPEHQSILGLLSDTLETKRADVATLAGKSTLNRLEHGLKSGVSRYHKISVIDAAMEQVFLDLYVAAHKSAPKRIILDLDATDDPLHGSPEGKIFHGYYRCYCYLPLYIFDGQHPARRQAGKRPTSTPQPVRKKTVRASWHMCVGPGRKLRSG